MKDDSVKSRREALGWSREKLAGEAGVAFRTVANIEDGHHQPRQSTVAVIEAALARGEAEAARRARRRETA